jgi:predicted ATP-binding protein involved in virulence
MLLKSLTLINVRVFSRAELTFKPGMNLIIGINGVGKSTILDVLRILLSQTLPKFSVPLQKNLSVAFTSQRGEIDLKHEYIGLITTLLTSKNPMLKAASVVRTGLKTMQAITEDSNADDSIYLLAHLQEILAARKRSKEINFVSTDVSCGKQQMGLSVKFEILENQFHYVVIQENPQIDPTQNNSNKNERELKPSPAKLQFKFSEDSFDIPLAIYFSTQRAISTSMKFSQASKTSGADAIFADALMSRQLDLREFTVWWLAQKTLAEEGSLLARGHLKVLTNALLNILSDYTNVRVERESYTHQDKEGKQTQKATVTLLLDKGEATLNINQLSDGERGILALVLDLARRLSQVNPHLEDPLQGRAIVLIDEIDLHLHPQWQRSIVQKLTTTFPNCQFIATTHSPLIIGEVPPENIILIAEDGEIIHPHQSLGMDTDWILKYIMGTTTRHTETTLELKRIADLIETEDYDAATDAIDILRDQIGEFPELVRLQTRVDRFQMLAE